MNITTHEKIDKELCGTPVELKEGYCKVEFMAQNRMVADSSGLVHGGFIFGLADYAAMLAVNHPNVVLGSANVTFLKPVKAGERVEAEAKIETLTDRKNIAKVVVTREGVPVFEGEFVCFSLDKHVLGHK